MNEEVVHGGTIGFIIWALLSLVFIGIGISGFFRKTTMGFWANAKTEPKKDIKRYNAAVGKLFIAYGIIFIILGLPLLFPTKPALMILSCTGVLFESIAIMVVYTVVIEKKYK